MPLNMAKTSVSKQVGLLSGRHVIRIFLLIQVHIGMNRLDPGGITCSRCFHGGRQPECSMPDFKDVDNWDWLLCVWKRVEYPVYAAEALHNTFPDGSAATCLSPWETVGESGAWLGLSAMQMVFQSQSRAVQPKGIHVDYLPALIQANDELCCRRIF